MTGCTAAPGLPGLIENIVECKESRYRYSRKIVSRLIENIVECKGWHTIEVREKEQRLIENIVECKDLPP